MLELNRKNASMTATYPEKIIQFGGGNFLRAFADWMVDLLNERADYRGSVVVIKPTPGGDYAELERQEGLFHVCLQGVSEGKTVDQCRLISAVKRQIHPYQDFEAYLKSAEQESIELIISNTTESGIVFRDSDAFSDRPALSFPGKLTQWLYHRYRHFQGSRDAGCEVLPCELIEKNGDKLREIVFEYSEKWQLPGEFRKWLAENIRFYNTLVDRIVPGFPEKDAGAIQERLGYRDDLLITAEPYHLWAIQGDQRIQEKFPAREAALNVSFVDDLAPVRTLKVRLLNGAHTAMVPVGILGGLSSVREAVEHKVTGRFIQKLLFEEIIPTLDHPRIEAEAYAQTVLERFRNPFIYHRLADIALNATDKFAARLQPSLEAFFERTGALPAALTFALAALIRFYKGEWNGRRLPVRDGESAVKHFQEAWEEDDLSLVARKALDFWEFPEELQHFLSKRVSDILHRLDERPPEQFFDTLVSSF